MVLFPVTFDFSCPFATCCRRFSRETSPSLLSDPNWEMMSLTLLSSKPSCLHVNEISGLQTIQNRHNMKTNKLPVSHQTAVKWLNKNLLWQVYETMLCCEISRLGVTKTWNALTRNQTTLTSVSRVIKLKWTRILRLYILQTQQHTFQDSHWPDRLLYLESFECFPLNFLSKFASNSPMKLKRTTHSRCRS